MPLAHHRLEDLVAAYRRFEEAGPDRGPAAAFLDAHPALRDALDPMIQDLARLDQAGRPRTDEHRLLGKVVGEFHLIRVLGLGGMGVVYEAVQLSLGRPVALKMLRPHLFAEAGIRRRFVHEAATAANLKHRGIIEVYSVGVHADVPYFVMEYVDGVSLHAAFERIRSRPDLARAEGLLFGTLASCRTPPTSVRHRERASEVPPSRAPALAREPYVREVVRAAAAVAEALAFIHDLGVVHRDVKPQNILLRTDTSVVLTDFGLAKILDARGTSSENEAIGTVGFMPAEQYRRGAAPVDHRTDIFALGATLYSLLSGRLLFDGDPARVLDSGPVSRLDVDCGVDDELTACIERAVQRRPDARYQHAHALADDLHGWLARHAAEPRTTTGPVVADARDRPASRVSTLRSLEELLRGRIVGQDETLHRVSAWIRLTKLRLDIRPHRPDGVFILVGPVSSGQRHLARCLTEVLHGDLDHLISVNLAEHSGPDAAQKLLGGPSRGPGSLTGPVKERGEGVLFLEDVDLANPLALELVRGALGQGTLIDGFGERVSFDSFVVLMTPSRAWELYERIYAAPSAGAAAEGDALRILCDRLPSEFLRCVDAVIPFRPLTDAALETIAGRELARVASQWRERFACTFELGSEVAKAVARRGADPRFGASHIGRNIEESVVGPLTLAVVDGALRPGAAVAVAVGPGGSGEISVQVAPGEPEEWVVDGLDAVPDPG